MTLRNEPQSRAWYRTHLPSALTLLPVFLSSFLSHCFQGSSLPFPAAMFPTACSAPRPWGPAPWGWPCSVCPSESAFHSFLNLLLPDTFSNNSHYIFSFYHRKNLFVRTFMLKGTLEASHSSFPQVYSKGNGLRQGK